MFTKEKQLLRNAKAAFLFCQEAAFYKSRLFLNALFS
jgi:hypothetical protein